MWAEENPDKCWKPYTVLHEDEGMEIRFKEQGRRKQRILSQTRSIPRQSTRSWELGKDMGDYYTSMPNQWMQAYPSEKRNLIDFKNGLIQGLEDDDLIEQCWSFFV